MLIKAFRFIKKYIEFRFHSKPRGGHGIHSPFVYDLYTRCVDVRSEDLVLEKIDAFRKQLRRNKTLVLRTAFGANPTVSSSEAISEIVKKSAIPSYQGQLLHRIVRYFKPDNIIELGTSLGISTMYMASGNNNARVITIEGDENLASLAVSNINKMGFSNVSVVNGDFDSQLPSVLSGIENLGIAFVDGNHTEEATMNYFKLLSAKANDDTLIIFDDIRWSKGMEKAWSNICSDSNVSISIDLFNVGIVFFRKGIVKQHFSLRYDPF